MFNKSDRGIVTFLLNVHAHLKRDYDFLLVVVGDTGTGKSIWALDLIETWYKVILQKEITKDSVECINTNYDVWLKRFRTMGEFDLNIYDEGATALDSKEFMSKISRDITKMFNVFRSKKFFSVIVLPNFFNLNKYFRQNRVRGLIYINKRGKYKLFTKKTINFINYINDKRTFKTLDGFDEIINNTFPDYKGVMLEQYLKNKNEGIDKILDEVIADNQEDIKSREDKLKDGFTRYKKLMQVKEARLDKLSYQGIADKISMPKSTVRDYIKELKLMDELPK